MRSRSRLLCSLLSLTLACTHAPARASNDGDLCSGLAMLICVPAVVVMGVASVFKPKRPSERLESALSGYNLDAAKQIVSSAGPAERARMLAETVPSYIHEDDAAGPVRLALIASMLDERQVDVSGELGKTMLQAVVSGRLVSSIPINGMGERQLAVARVFIAHGARADGVMLGDCNDCSTDVEFLRVMAQAGADINRGGDRSPLFDRVAEYGDLKAAEGLIAAGADPNGQFAGGKGMLQRMAARCDLKPGLSARSAAREAYLQRCVEESVTRTRFAVTHGADPNGRVTWEQGHCETPYAVALRMQNTALADALRALGADPEFSARCLAAAPRRP